MAEEEKKPSGKQKSSKKQSRKGLILWIGLTLFACAWMFVLGIFVGRETVPVRFDIEKLQNELAALKERVIKKELNQYNIDSNTDVTKTQMKFYETLKKTGKEESLKNTGVKQQKKSLPEKTVSAQMVKTPSKTVDSARKEKKSGLKKLAQNNPAAVENPPANHARGNDQGTDQADKNYTIQVASMRDSRDADKLVNKLKKEGYPAYRSIGKVPGKGIWFRVRVGYFKNRTDAGLTLKQLKKEKLKAVIVRR
jgi:cell division septation protein DedD